MNKYDCGEKLGTKVNAYIFEEAQERLIELARETDVTDESRYCFMLDGVSDISYLTDHLYKQMAPLELAKLHERIAIYDLNMVAYSFSPANALQRSSCFYYKAGLKEEAELTARRNYLGFSKEHKRIYEYLELLTVDDYKSDETDGRIADLTESVTHIELLGDMCWFFDHDRARMYYRSARDKLNIINEVDPNQLEYMNYVYEWSSSMQMYTPALRYCLGLNLYNLDDVEFAAHINAKEAFLDHISL